MGHSDIGVTMNTYTHLGLDAARDEMVRMEKLDQARKSRVAIWIVPQSNRPSK